jgi:hypothetical protein
VTARANGSATITATAEGKTATAGITVRQVAATLSISPTFAGVQSLGESRTFAATAADARGNPVTTAIGWSSSDENIATVTNGVAVGKSIGTATITASSGTQRASASFTVNQVPAAIVITADRTSIQIGSSTQVRARITDANGNPIANAPAGFQSQNPSIATVSATGVVTGVGLGDATITAGSAPRIASIVIHVVGIPGVTPTGGTVSGVVRDAATGLPISGASVTPTGGSPVTTATDGSFTLANIASGTNLTIAASGYVSTTYFGATAPTSGNTSLGTLPLAPASQANGSFSGRIVDAVTGFAIPNAVITVRSGINNTTGAMVFNTASNEGGNYTASLLAGTYTVTATATGYVNASGTVPSVGGSSLTNQNIVMNPGGLSSGSYRIVVQWGASPTDLDSHLVGPTGNGTTFEIAYYARSYSQGGVQIAQLDRDVTSGFGPETITLTPNAAGHYRYYIHIFCCGSSFGTAQVTVYRGSDATPAAQFSAPAQTGSVWTVFEIDGTTGGITGINTVSGSYNIPGAGSPSFNVIPSRDAMPEDVSALLQRVKLHPKPIAKPARP